MKDADEFATDIASLCVDANIKRVEVDMIEYGTRIDTFKVRNVGNER